MAIRTMLIAYVATLFLSSLLMFLLEPMAAKMVLPLLGGAPSVWNTCVVFFQVMLLLGYAYAHSAPAWLGIRRQAIFHVLLVIGAGVTLPFTIGATATSAAPATHPIVWLLLLLLTSIGLPFFVLTTTAPLLQKWFSRTRHRSARDPYFLYAASNVGSLAGLFMYPGLVERAFRLQDQARVWAFGYAAFAVLVVLSAAFLWRGEPAEVDTGTGPSSAVDPRGGIDVIRRLRWVALAFAPSSLMLAVTTFVSTDIAAVPLLWIIPLALYLLSFVIAFNSSAAYPRALVARGVPLLMLPLVFLLVLRVTGPMAVVLPVHLLLFFFAALLCHRELADDRPNANQLTEFYLWVAFGGVLGSLFNTLAAPMLFTGIVEYPLVLVLVCLLRGVPLFESASGRGLAVGLAFAAGAATLALMLFGGNLAANTRFALLAVPGFLCLRVSRARVPFAVAIGLMLLASAFQRDQYGTVLHGERTFFGIYRVTIDAAAKYRSLYHGTTLHGMQSVAVDRRGEPLTYYHRRGPFGELFRAVPTAAAHPQIAVVGLGVGSLATYRQSAQQQWTFYEIDGVVERIARTDEYFTFLSECGDACSVVLGDARLSLNATADRRYGLIVLDAFSSDAIPVHLLTREALELYLSRLAGGGALAFHISNRHLNLEPVLGRLAGELGLTFLTRRDRVSDDELAAGRTSSDWLVMARLAADLGSLPADPRWTASALDPGVPVWTDDFSNILSVLVPR